MLVLHVTKDAFEGRNFVYGLVGLPRIYAVIPGQDEAQFLRPIQGMQLLNIEWFLVIFPFPDGRGAGNGELIHPIGPADLPRKSADSFVDPVIMELTKLSA